MFNNNHKASALISFITVLVCSGISANPANAETFVLNGNKALNTNGNFSLIDGHPRMSIWDHVPNDADQNFDRKPGGKGGELLVHRRTGKCLNAYRRWNGAEINVYPCNASDADQNFKIESLSNGEVQIKVANTNFCVDSPTRNNGGKVTLWDCVANANQRWRSSLVNVITPNGQINLPFKSGQTWYVCQGYQGYISHNSYYALDLTVSNQDFGSTACWANDGNASKSAGQPLLAPASGTIYHVNSDLVCLSLDDKKHSLLLGHINRIVGNGARVNKDDVLGYTSKASSVNGGFSHIHLEGRNSSNCAIGTTAPMTEANGMKLNGVGDLPDIAGRNDYFKKALTRP